MEYPVFLTIEYPVPVEVGSDKIKLDWEGRAYKWCAYKEIQKKKLLPGFDQVLEKLSKWF